uniref:Hint domain-containing protein n=1 Tax=Compsopogon caeruleus TaxID=31354 RepID=A0A7S1TI05_9RHOD|mmetsp:Transcript_8672/g.17599  ORF Transcript_8672/g.17599 Transcript_8672/m.17599 type:complete len:490 (+) Transcript_8672:103-1572(+)|eukprot:CAMPEP_0184686814 /NCGR_PEP_ID=MMETSP0312-20130426/24146_1 /TAXON_ID=31354 /ORGANISM="Compsopogon coeruleus, Strain SAG 36.94" /LENGTH=489 /DNA_ID=CAMNT_0027142317 /DNA_START=52 /DNA_END=1521 /DNA_ORIENTATION=-
MIWFLGYGLWVVGLIGLLFHGGMGQCSLTACITNQGLSCVNPNLTQSSLMNITTCCPIVDQLSQCPQFSDNNCIMGDRLVNDTRVQILSSQRICSSSDNVTARVGELFPGEGIYFPPSLIAPFRCTTQLAWCKSVYSFTGACQARRRRTACFETQVKNCTDQGLKDVYPNGLIGNLTEATERLCTNATAKPTPSATPTTSPLPSSAPSPSSGATGSPSPTPTPTLSTNTSACEKALMYCGSSSFEGLSVTGAVDCNLATQYRDCVLLAGGNECSQSSPLAYEATLNIAESREREGCADSVCLSENVKVELASGELISIQNLHVGDRVRVSATGYSDVYFFSHRRVDALYPFYRIYFGEEGHAIEISGDHLMYINGQRIAARFVKAGDFVPIFGDDGFESTSRVEKVELVQARGLYHPHTLHGDIIVSGARISTFATYLSPHVSTALLFPERLAYALGTSMFGSFLEGHHPAWAQDLLRWMRRNHLASSK